MKVSITDITADEEAVFTRAFGPAPDDPSNPISFEQWLTAMARTWLAGKYQHGHRDLVQDKIDEGKVVTSALQAKRDHDPVPGDKAHGLKVRARTARRIARNKAEAEG
jgi:hypothetical protein